MRVPFSKYQGAGNDFIIIDDRSLFFPISASLINHLCKRSFGIGADGVILLQPSERADFKMRIFNADGKEAAMCGNGIRCLGSFLRTISNKKMHHIETLSQVVALEDKAELFAYTIQDAHIVEQNITLTFEDHTFVFDVINTGVPHAVIFVNNLVNFDVEHFGKIIRNHPRFSPHGVNATFAKVLSSHILEVRTFERGVEKETLACGTGAAAAAINASLTHQWKESVTMHTASKEILHAWLKGWKISRGEVSLSGPAHFVFDGIFAIP